MRVEQSKLWESDSETYYVKYLLDNSGEIEADRKHPAVIVCPGGGYMYTSDREAEPIAMTFLAAGYNAFVLRYTTTSNGNPAYPNPVYDAARLMQTVRENAAEWGVDPDKIAICGFSAGGHLAASLAVRWQDAFLSEKLGAAPEQLRPNAVILGYPWLDVAHTNEIALRGADDNFKALMRKIDTAMLGENFTEETIAEANPIHHVGPNVPPTFLWHTAGDGLIPAGNSLKLALQLENHGVPYELHVFETGGHGLSLATKVTGKNEQLNADAAQWLGLALRFLARHFEQ
ncbi:alpha/beta hydrolase [Paenibacillus aurantiacus]|uniref:Alpha/beta hydrolase n=1 Tax=Paenibacillus aurantiacus TaxID=1936118 RepID=A0ABV5KM19_9BACL